MPPMSNSASHDEKPGLLSNAIALIAFLIVMAIVVWGLLHMASLSTSWFSSTFAPRKVAIRAATTPAALPEPVITSTAKPSATPKPVASAAAAPAAPVYRGPADIAVHIVSATPGNPSTVEFDVANIGGSASGAYTFTAYLPTDGGYVYESPLQYSLAPGAHMVNTLRFSQAQAGAVTIVVHASDGNQGNNTTSTYVAQQYSYDAYYSQPYQYDYPYQQDGYGYPYQYPYDYSQYQYSY